MSGAYTSVQVLPDADTPMKVTVFTGEHTGKVLASIEIGDVGHGISLLVSDEETVNALACVIGEARAKLVAAVTRAKQEAAGQPELPVAC